MPSAKEIITLNFVHRVKEKPWKARVKMPTTDVPITPIKYKTLKYDATPKRDKREHRLATTRQTK